MSERLSAHDVTALNASNVEAEQHARVYEARLQTVLANLPAILCVIDRTGIITLLAGKEVELRGHNAGEAIVRSIVTLAHSLDLQVVAEGVEDQATWQMLSALDCETAQGYYMSRPLPAQELEHWLQNTNETVAY